MCDACRGAKMVRVETLVSWAMTEGRTTYIEGEEDLGWLREVHCPGLPAEAVCALLWGNEDAPEKVQAYAENNIYAAPVASYVDGRRGRQEPPEGWTGSAPGVPGKGER